MQEMQITAFVMTNESPNPTKNPIQVADDIRNPSYVWVDGTTVYMYPKSKTIELYGDISQMFYWYNNLVSVDTLNWDTSDVINMDMVFTACWELTTLDLSHWNTEKVQSMEEIFSICSALTSLNVSNWNTSNVKSLRGAFSTCDVLTTLDVSHWDVSNVTNMEFTFDYNPLLVSLDLSGWNTPNVTIMSRMFNNCESLTTLNISNFDTSKVVDMTNMFNSCYNLNTIVYGPNFVNSSIENIKVDDDTNGTNDMFYECPANKPNWTNGSWNSSNRFVGV